MRRVDPPPGVRESYRAWTWSVAWSYQGVVITWRLSSADQVWFLKEFELSRKRRVSWPRQRGCAGHETTCPSPSVVDCGTEDTEDDVDWLVVDALPAIDATAPELKARPEWLVPLLARGLRRFHEAPVKACPFRLTVGDALVAVRQRVADRQSYRTDPHTQSSAIFPWMTRWRRSRSWHPRKRAWSCATAITAFPNVLIEGHAVTGYLDVGDLAIADPGGTSQSFRGAQRGNVAPGGRRFSSTPLASNQIRPG